MFPRHSLLRIAVASIVFAVIAMFLDALTARACDEGAVAVRDKAQYETEPRELLVTFSPEATPERVKQINDKLGVVVIDTMFAGRVYQVKVPGDAPLEIIQAAYASYKEVISVEPNYRVRIKQ